MFSKLTPFKKKQTDVAMPREDHPITRFRQDIDELWNRMWEDWRSGDLNLRDGLHSVGPRMNFDDDEKEYVLRAELPGFEPDEIDVKVSGNMLTLRAEHREEGQEGKGNYRRYGSFCESFTLPHGVMADQIDARYHSGMLEVHMPKGEECETKRIEVKAT